ncbi:MAG: BolA/IbaG family iron-sulfur metabolism protein [Candidatus Tisiphia sp.]
MSIKDGLTLTSYLHNLSDRPSHNGGITESHLKIKIFIAVFIEKSLLEQHKIINNLLADELASGLHALSIGTKPPTHLTRS